MLAFFLDFFELSFIIIPLIGPVADKLGIDLIWFGVLLGVNMQTSFMHPPFGFALFYLRSVAPAKEYLDQLTGKHDRAGDHRPDLLGRGAVRADPGRSWSALIIAFPNIVSGGLATKEKVDIREHPDRDAGRGSDAGRRRHPGGAADASRTTRRRRSRRR